MEKRHADRSTDFDKPIVKPFEELPDSFVQNLHSRMVTLKKKNGSQDKRLDTKRSQH